jgi:signal transduction histidine kinase
MKRAHHNQSTPESNARPGAQLMHVMLEGLDEGVANVSLKGTILYANSRFAELLSARPQDALMGSNLKKFIAPAGWEDLDAALARGRQIRTEGAMTLEGFSGRPRIIRISLSPVRLNGEATIKIAASEVTELMDKAEALKESERSLHSLSARILQLQDQERRRIARDLHDITGQELAVVVMSLNQLARKLERSDSGAQKGIVEAVGLVRKVEDEIRTLSYLLHPPLLDEFGLGSALQWYVEGFTKRSRIEVDLKLQPDLPRLSTEKETALFRVVQEGLTNVLRHSGSPRARIAVSFDAEGVRLLIEDEGRGIDRGKLADVNAAGMDAGVGIAGMRERLQQLGGTLVIRPRHKGTRVTATLPIENAERAGLEAETAALEAAAEDHAEEVEAPSSPTVKKRILIADDHEVTRQGIKALLREESDLEVCGEATDGLDAVVKAKELNPDLVIMDLVMPRVGGFSAATSLRNSGSPAKIVFFSTHSYSQLEKLSRTAGFEAFVSKANAGYDLVRGVRAVLDGKKFYGSEIIDEGGPSRPPERQLVRDHAVKG